jgi:hypothetical protein
LEGLLTLFVALTAIAIVTQAGVLVGIYVMSKRLSEQIERFMKDTREMMSPVRSIADNLRTASANLVEIGLSARDQFRRVEAMVTDTGEALTVQLERFDRVSQNVMDSDQRDSRDRSGFRRPSCARSRSRGEGTHARARFLFWTWAQHSGSGATGRRAVHLMKRLFGG